MGLNVADTNRPAKAFVRRHGWAWPSIADRDRKLAGRLSAAWQPGVVLIDPRGRIAGVHVGPGNAAAWNRLWRSATS